MMRIGLAALLLLTCGCEVKSPALPGGARRLAIATFDNHTGDPTFDPLPVGLAHLLRADLSQINALAIDASSPELILRGQLVMAGEQLRIEPAIIEVGSGTRLGGHPIAAQPALFFALEKELVEQVLATMALEPSIGEKAELRRYPSESFAAWLSFSGGLVAEADGQIDEARRRFGAALNADPGFAAARLAHDRLEVSAALAEIRAEPTYEDLERTVDPEADDYGDQIHALFMAAGSGSSTETLRQKLILLQWVVDHKVPPTVDALGGYHPEVFELFSLAVYYSMDPRAMELLPAVFAYVQKRYPEDPFTTALSATLQTVEANRAAAAADPVRWREQWQLSLDRWTLDPARAGIPTERGRALVLFAFISKRLGG